MEKIGRTYLVKNEEIFNREKEERNIAHKIKTRKVNWICHFLFRTCPLKCVIAEMAEGKIEGTRTRRRRHKELLNCLKKR